MVDERIIFKDVLVIYHHVGATKKVCHVGTHTHRVVVIDLPVGSCRIHQLVVLPCHGVGALLMEYLAGACGLFKPAVLVVILSAIKDAAKHINIILAVVDAEFTVGGVEPIAQVLLIGEREVNAHAVALLASGTDAHHRPHSGIILCSRIVDDFHISDVLAAQPLQLAIVTHNLSVDVDERAAFPEHLRIVLGASHSRHLDEHFAYRPRCSERCSLNACDDGVALETSVGEVAFNDYFHQLYHLVAT